MIQIEVAFCCSHPDCDRDGEGFALNTNPASMWTEVQAELQRLANKHKYTIRGDQILCELHSKLADGVWEWMDEVAPAG